MTDQGPGFAARLSAAIAASGLSLGRVRELLEERDVSLSTATLSYWSTGRSRPSRAKSLSGVGKLEEVLGLPPGALLDALPQDDTSTTVHSIVGQEALIRAAIEEHQIARGYYWHQLEVSHHAHIGVDRAEKDFRLDMVVRAILPGAQKWAVLQGGTTTAVAGEGIHGTRLLRTLDIAPDLVVLEFGIDEPLDVGEEVSVHTRVHFPDSGDPCDQMEYLLARPGELLTMTATFAGDVPDRFEYAHRSPGGAEETVRALVQRLGDSAQAVIASPQAGQHVLRWQW